MEYCPEIAVLHSALLFAEKLIGPGRLTAYTKGGHPDILSVLITAVKEISLGLGHVSPATEADLNKTKLTVALLVKVILGTAENVSEKLPHEMQVSAELASTGDVSVELPCEAVGGGVEIKTVEGVNGLSSPLNGLDPVEGLSVELSALEELFDSVTYGLPPLSWALLFDVIKHGDLWRYLMKLLPCLPQPIRINVLHKIVIYLVDNPDDLDLKYLVDILYFMSLRELSPQNDTGKTETETNSLLFSGKSIINNKTKFEDVSNSLPFVDPMLSSEEINLLSNLYKGLIGAKRCEVEVWRILEILLQGIEHVDLGRLNGPDTAVMMLSLYSLVSRSICGDGMVLSHQNPSVNEEGMTENQGISPLTFLHTFLTDQSEVMTNVSLVDIIVSEVKANELPLVKVMQLPNLRLPVCLRLLNKILDLYADSPVRFRDHVVQFTPCYTSNPLHVVLWERLCHQILSDSFSGLVKAVEGELKTSLPAAEIKELLGKIEPIERAFHTKMDSERWGSGIMRLEKAEVILSKRIRGWRGELLWLLEVTEKDIIQQPRWLQCIKQSCSLVNESRTLSVAVHRLHWFRKGLADWGTELVDHCRQIVVDMVEQCSLDIINACIQDLSSVLTHQDLQFIFDVTSSVSDHLRSALNRLTNENQQQCAHKLAVLGLQSPVSVVKEIVNIAVHNKGQIQALIQVLQQLPSLLRFVEYELNPLIAGITECFNQLYSLSDKECTNLVQFAGQLMQPYSLPVSSICQPPLLPPSGLLHHIVLPTLLSDVSMDSLTHRGKHSLSVRFFVTALDTMAELDPDWSELINQSEPILLLYVICQKLQLCSMNCGSDLDIGSGLDLHDMNRVDWLHGLEMMRKICSKHPGLILEAEVQWLLARTQHHTWLSTWYIYTALSTTSLTSQLHLELPRGVLDCVSLPVDLAVSPGLDDVDGILSLLMFSRVSDVTLNLIQMNIKRPLAVEPENIEHRLTYCLALLLADSAEQEWVRLCRCVQLIFSCSSAPLTTSIGVACIHILLQAVLILTETTTLPSTRLIDWHLMTTKLVTAVKEAVLEEITAPSAARDLCQCFQLLCNSFSYWPDLDSAQLLLPLPLDIISRLDSCLTNQGGDESRQSFVESSKKSVFNYLIDYCDSVPFEDIRGTLSKVLASS